MIKAPILIPNVPRSNEFLHGNSYLAANGFYDTWHYLTIVDNSWSSLSINMPQVAIHVGMPPILPIK